MPFWSAAYATCPTTPYDDEGTPEYLLTMIVSYSCCGIDKGVCDGFYEDDFNFGDGCGIKGFRGYDADGNTDLVCKCNDEGSMDCEGDISSEEEKCLAKENCESELNVGLIAGVGIGVLVVIGLLIFCGRKYGYCCKKKDGVKPAMSGSGSAPKETEIVPGGQASP